MKSQAQLLTFPVAAVAVRPLCDSPLTFPVASGRNPAPSWGRTEAETAPSWGRTEADTVTRQAARAARRASDLMTKDGRTGGRSSAKRRAGEVLLT